MSGAVLCFMALTGFTVSVVRAPGVMVLLGIIAPVLSESADSLTSLGAAVLLLTALNPAAAADIGLLLSVSSVLGILAGGAIYAEYLSRREARKQKNGRRQKLLGYLVTPVSATPRHDAGPDRNRRRDLDLLGRGQSNCRAADNTGGDLGAADRPDR